MNQPFETITPAPLHASALPSMVAMRDGIRLATDVYLPRGEHTAPPGPTILVRLPYDKCGTYTQLSLIAEYFTARGYRVAVQDVRGKFRSEGETLLFVNEVHDGYDTIEWITHQPWSDGVVGMWGDSYYGCTQWAAVASGHPALRAIAPRVTGTDLGQVLDHGDGDGTRDVEQGVHLAYMATHFVANDTYEWEPDLDTRPLIAPFEEFFSALGRRSPSFDIAHPHGHDRLLRRWPEGHPFDQRAIPVLQTVGWYDNCAPWQWRDVEELNHRPAWAANQYLLIDAIDHENHHIAHAPYNETTDHDLNEDAYRALLPGYLDPALEFFDIFLRGHGDAAELPCVRWNLVHGDGPELRTSTCWPPTDTEPLTLHLTPDKEPPTGSTPGLLSPHPSQPTARGPTTPKTLSLPPPPTPSPTSRPTPACTTGPSAPTSSSSTPHPRPTPSTSPAPSPSPSPPQAPPPTCAPSSSTSTRTAKQNSSHTAAFTPSLVRAA